MFRRLEYLTNFFTAEKEERREYAEITPLRKLCDLCGAAVNVGLDV
jgi:hypothetical protein